MATKKDSLNDLLYDLKRIPEHREVLSEKKIEKLYNDLTNELNGFLGNEYAKYANGQGQLSFTTIEEQARKARFLEEIVKKVDTISPQVKKEIMSLVEDTYSASYKGMIDAVKQANNTQELAKVMDNTMVRPEVLKKAINNNVNKLTLPAVLEKNRQDIIYQIQQELAVGMMNGDRYEKMANRIADRVGVGKSKAKNIVRTESHRNIEAGLMDCAKDISQGLEDSDLVYVAIWRTMKDERVRPQQRYKTKKGWKTSKKKNGADHQKMEGQVVKVGDTFQLEPGVFAECPGMSNTARNDCNCRCFLEYDLMTAEEYFKATGKEIFTLEQKLERNENKLLAEQHDLEDEQAKLEQRKANLEAYEYKGIWKDTVTPADYESRKDRIQGKRDYYNDDILAAQNRTGKYANTNFYSDADLANIITKDKQFLDMLDDFEAQGKTYIKITDRLSEIDKKLPDIKDKIKDVRQELMNARNIDPDKLKAQIGKLEDKLKNLTPPKTGQEIFADLKQIEYNGTYGWEYLCDKQIQIDIDDRIKLLEEQKKAGTISSYGKDKLKALKAFKKNVFDSMPKANLDEILKSDFKSIADLADYLFDKLDDAKTAALKHKRHKQYLEKQIADKKKELDDIIKRYGLEVPDDKFSQKRKDAAYWFTDKNGSVESADKVLRDKCGEVWRNANTAQRHSAYEYTQSYHKYNEPLRGIEYGTSKFVGVGKIDFDDIGVSTGYGMKKGEVKKLIDDLTDIIDESTYDFDMWFQRGCRYSGMDKFFNVDLNDFYGSEADLAKKLLGSTPTEYAFMSTGVSKGKGLNLSGSGITLNIYAPKGTKMLYCEPFSAFGNGSGKNWDGKTSQSYFGHEAEMLFQRNTKFRVIKVEKSGDRWYIDMEVISQDR